MKLTTTYLVLLQLMIIFILPKSSSSFGSKNSSKRWNELKFVFGHDRHVMIRMMQLLVVKDFRSEVLKPYVLGCLGECGRTNLAGSLKAFIHENDVFRDKLLFPSTSTGRLNELLNQSMYWQHLRCPEYSRRPLSSLELESLFADHTCDQVHELSPSGQCPVINPFADGFMPRPDCQWATLLPMRFTIPKVPTERPLLFPPETVATSPEHSLISRNTASSTIHQPITAIANSAVDGEAAPEDFPKKVVAYLNEGSSVSCMAFHPSKHDLLLVGTYTGDVSIWHVGYKKRLVYRKFKASQVDNTVSVSCVSWSLYGEAIGVGYSNQILHIYLYRGGAELHKCRQFDAHAGYVRDLAFSKLKPKVVVTCGDDKSVKVWDCTTGSSLVFEGHHKAPVHSVCLHYVKDDEGKWSESIVSTAVDGRIIIWTTGLNSSYLAPGLSIMRMRSSADGSRLFSCGTNKEGVSYLVEWEDYKAGLLRRRYWGLGKSANVVQFDISRNKYLAVGDESVIKFWHMDHSNLLETIDVGGLPASPCIRFNKEGTLLAVSTVNNAIKVLANADGMELVRFRETLSLRL